MSNPLESCARRLPRLGVAFIPETDWSNPLPARGVTPAQLAAYWTELTGAVVGWYERRGAVFGEHFDDYFVRFRYGDGTTVETTPPSVPGRTAMVTATPCPRLDPEMRPSKLEVTLAEGVAALLHQVIAPRAPFACDGWCSHVATGATPQQAKRFLDSLDADLASTADLLEDGFESDSQATLFAWRAKFAHLLGASANASVAGQEASQDSRGESDVEDVFLLMASASVHQFAVWLESGAIELQEQLDLADSHRRQRLSWEISACRRIAEALQKFVVNPSHYWDYTWNALHSQDADEVGVALFSAYLGQQVAYWTGRLAPEGDFLTEADARLHVVNAARELFHRLLGVPPDVVARRSEDLNLDEATRSTPTPNYKRCGVVISSAEEGPLPREEVAERTARAEAAEEKQRRANEQSQAAEVMP